MRFVRLWGAKQKRNVEESVKVNRNRHLRGNEEAAGDRAGGMGRGRDEVGRGRMRKKIWG